MCEVVSFVKGLGRQSDGYTETTNTKMQINTFRRNRRPQSSAQMLSSLAEEDMREVQRRAVANGAMRGHL